MNENSDNFKCNFKDMNVKSNENAPDTYLPTSEVILQSPIFIESLRSHEMMTSGTPLKLEERVKMVMSLYSKFHPIFLNVHNFYIRYYFFKIIAP